MTNWYEFEQFLIERIKDNVPELYFVAGWPASDEYIKRAASQLPAALVAPAADEFQNFSGHNPLPEQQLKQLWAILIAERNVNVAMHGQPIRKDIGRLIHLVAHSVIGWQPDDNRFGRVEAVGRGEADTLDGIDIYTFVVQTEVMIYGN